MRLLAHMKHHTVKFSPVVAGATSVAALFAASSLDAGIITNTALSLAGATVGDGGVSSYDWNIDGAGGVEITLSSSSSYIGMYGGVNGFDLAVGGGLNQPLNLGAGAYVSNGLFLGGSFFSSVLTAGSISNATGFTSGESGYLGFQFTPGTTKLYGWAEVILTEGSPAGSFQIVQWAYEDSGANIQTPGGAIPEPAGAATGLGLLALGAAGVRRMRRPQAA